MSHIFFAGVRQGWRINRGVKWEHRQGIEGDRVERKRLGEHVPVRRDMREARAIPAAGSLSGLVLDAGDNRGGCM